MILLILGIWEEMCDWTKPLNQSIQFLFQINLNIQVRSLPHMPGALDSYKEKAARVSCLVATLCTYHQQVTSWFRCSFSTFISELYQQVSWLHKEEEWIISSRSTVPRDKKKPWQSWLSGTLWCWRWQFGGTKATCCWRGGGPRSWQEKQEQREQVKMICHSRSKI